jgi:hypothetical protein
MSKQTDIVTELVDALDQLVDFAGREDPITDRARAAIAAAKCGTREEAIPTAGRCAHPEGCEATRAPGDIYCLDCRSAVDRTRELAASLDAMA